MVVCVETSPGRERKWFRKTGPSRGWTPRTTRREFKTTPVEGRPHAEARARGGEVTRGGEDTGGGSSLGVPDDRPGDDVDPDHPQGGSQTVRPLPGTSKCLGETRGGFSNLTS